ncbi:N-acetylglucosaminyl-phosphatidylinositol de-N-acetylase isoform X2 [Fundulus heteroclitus]|uniref:N-acetylglucosaminyl-phosphatidylinositol de-N-acetylase isoform X2 n=1 Tax=Fundulus heteroclitus TaxID=8078 RepID=UPI00165B8E4F|nr:N-acetylglucosaminyl-phosphatidylinositol de-N-acetylase isoform X2 [Fundulus heteroclitus]
MYVYLVAFVPLFYLVWIKCIYDRHRHTLRSSLKSTMNVSSERDTDGADVRALVVTAHPDDEWNYYNQGAQRREELLSSCATLGIPASRVTIIDHKNLPDDPKAEWSISLVSSAVLKHITAHSINMVLTFDGRGVSGHANHVAIYKAVRHLASTGELPKECVLLSLETVGLLRKYISFLDLPFSWLLPSHLCCVVGSKGYKQAKAAMLCHRTQLLWFRYLYITFSRYMFINTFQTIPQGPKNLKIY